MVKRNEIINGKNKKLFVRYGLSNTDKIYKCTICGRTISLNDSYSNKGGNLTCLTCCFKYFGGNYNECTL